MLPSSLALFLVSFPRTARPLQLLFSSQNLFATADPCAPIDPSHPPLPQDPSTPVQLPATRRPALLPLQKTGFPLPSSGPCHAAYVFDLSHCEPVVRDLVGYLPSTWPPPTRSGWRFCQSGLSSLSLVFFLFSPLFFASARGVFSPAQRPSSLPPPGGSLASAYRAPARVTRILYFRCRKERGKRGSSLQKKGGLRVVLPYVHVIQRKREGTTHAAAASF
jgi:hypothetical protein